MGDIVKGRGGGRCKEEAGGVRASLWFSSRKGLENPRVTESPRGGALFLQEGACLPPPPPMLPPWLEQP